MVAILKVCHLISGDLWAGAEVMVFSLLRELQELPELELSVVVLNEGRLAEELRNLEIVMRVIDERRVSFPKLVLEARAFMRQRSFQVIHSHRYKENIITFLARGRQAKAVATQHGMPETGHGMFSIASQFVSKIDCYLLSKRFDKLVGVSSNIQRHFLGCGARPDRLCVIHNGISLPRIYQRSLKPVIAVGSAGRFFPVKDYPLMVEIARIISENKAQVRFELAGDGPGRDGLEKLITDYGLSRLFRLCGQITEMDGFYTGLDVYLNTSLHEGIPMSILEAMSHGLPVIAPRVGGIVDIIEDGVNGFLVSSRSPEEFAEKCIMLQNAELRKKMGKAARAKVEESFSAKAMAQQYHRVYKEVMEL
jgi:L-malate glycosyltransferase